MDIKLKSNGVRDLILEAIIKNSKNTTIGYKIRDKNGDILKLKVSDAIELTKAGVITNAVVVSNKYLKSTSGALRKDYVDCSIQTESIPETKRMGYYEVESFIEKSDTVALVLSGIRRVGKTTILKQITSKYSDRATYIDIKDARNLSVDLYDTVRLNIDKGKDIIIIDECNLISDAEYCIRAIYDLCLYSKCRLIVSGSSIAHLNEIAYNWLGARCIKIDIPMITFTEYLVITGKIDTYNTKLNSVDTENFNRLRQYTDSVEESYFTDYIKLNGYQDKVHTSEYLKSIVEETAKSNSNFRFMTVNIDFKSLEAVMYGLVYKSFKQVLYDTFLIRRENDAYSKEIYNIMGDSSIKELSIERNIIAKLISSNKKLMLYDIRTILNTVDSSDIFSAIEFLINYGIAYVDTDSTIDIREFNQYMLKIKTEYLSSGKVEKKSMEYMFNRYSICIINPIIYYPILREFTKFISTEVNLKIESTQLLKSHLLGEIVENYIKGAASMCSTYCPYSVYTISNELSPYVEVGKSREIDLMSKELLMICEITHKNKAISKTNFDKLKLIMDESTLGMYKKILTTRDVFDVYGDIQRVPYYKLMILLDSIRFSKVMSKIDNRVDYDFE